MPRFRQVSRALPIYLIPIMIGMCGVLLSRQFDGMLLRIPIVLLSIAGPLFALGSVTSNLRLPKGQKRLMAAGAVMLFFGGSVTLYDFWGGDAGVSVLTGLRLGSLNIWAVSKWLLLLALLIVLVILLMSVVRREQEVSALADQFRSLSDHMSEGFLLADPLGTIILANESFYRMTGFTPRDIMGHDALDLAQQFDLQPMHTSHHEDVGSEYRLTWNRNNLERCFWVSGRPVRGLRGELVGTLATFRDISEQEDMARRLKKYSQGLQQLAAERTHQLRQSEQRLRDLLLHMSEGFMTLDATLHIAFANERIQALLRRSVEQLAGCSLLDFLDPPAKGRFLELLRHAKGGAGHVSRHELVLMRPDGEAIQAVAALSIIEDASAGERFALVLTDVSDLKAMQRQLQERADQLEAANTELRQLDRAKDGFLTNVSHELRTPLSTIKGYLEMFEGGGLGSLDEIQSNAMRVIRRNADRLGLLIEELLDFSRIQIRGIELNRTLFSLASLLEDCANSSSPLLDAKEMTVETAAHTGLPVIWGDRQRIHQVLMILISNAIKFSHKKSKIAVTISERGRNAIALAVTDTGIGISKQNHKRVFDKFYQVDSSLARRYEGAGIGLTIAKTIVEQHGGTIEITSELHQGSTFMVLLPGAVFDARVPDAACEALKGCSLLLLDDERETAETLGAVFTEAGMRVTTAAGSFDAIRKCSDEEFDIILLNDTMRDLASLATVSRLHETSLPGATHVLISLREQADAETADRFQRLDAEVIRRPFPAAVLAASMVRMITGETIELTESSSGVATPGPAPRQGLAILLIEADEGIIAWLGYGLRRRGIQCVAAPTVEQAATIAPLHGVDAILLDVDQAADSLSDTLEALRWAVDEPALPVIGLTGRRDIPSTRLGVDALLHKPFKLRDAVDAIVGTIALRGPAGLQVINKYDGAPDTHDDDDE